MLRKLARLCLLIILGFAFLPIAGGCTSRAYSPAGQTTTVVLIRHAERTVVTKELTEAGHDRAEALPRALQGMDIAAIYSPDLARNLDTVRPLAEQRGISVTVLDRRTSISEIVQRLLRDHPGSTVLWVGNTTNLDRIYPDLGGTGAPPVKYGDLYILKVPDQGDTRIERRRFGD